MNANVTGKPGTAPTVAAPAGAPGTGAGGDRDTTAKILGNGRDINSICENFGAAGGRDGGAGNGAWCGGNLATSGVAGVPIAANSYKLVSENFTVSKNAAPHQNRNTLLFRNLRTRYQSCTGTRGLRTCEASVLRGEAGLRRTRSFPDCLPRGEGLSQAARGGCNGH
jgi:hypothetical protein